MTTNHDNIISKPPVKLGILTRVPGSTEVCVAELGGRRVIAVFSNPGQQRGAFRQDDGAKISRAATLAKENLLPLVLILSTSGASISDGVPALVSWGRAAKAISDISGIVPILIGLTGPAISGPALLLGLADIVISTVDSYAYVSGPAMVEEFTGVKTSNSELGGSHIQASRSGVTSIEVTDESEILEGLAEVLSYLPNSTDHLPLRIDDDDDPNRICDELAKVIPASPTGSYDVRHIIADISDNGEYLELRAKWAPQLVTCLARIGGRSVGVIANQPQAMAGTLDIQASQKGARFVRFCSAFNLPLITLVDTPGFLPGKDIEWRGMIRHGAELAFSYAACSVPRICVIMRKAYGGAYIVMDSKGMGSDIVFAWPQAEIAVMGAQGAAQILMRRASDEERLAYQNSYQQTYLTPWKAAERGFVDAVIDPVSTRSEINAALDILITKKEHVRPSKHANSPL
ncbi:MAG: methylmalonyl-CoA carboxyltransferase [Actinomycetota bacterium]|nr:methylmalonyl-CoA carboxyltransferase [Actinomycetota bacterium]